MMKKSSVLIWPGIYKTVSVWNKHAETVMKQNHWSWMRAEFQLGAEHFAYMISFILQNNSGR